MSWLILCFGLVLGNFIAKWIGDKDYVEAAERSVFQIIAVVVVYWAQPWR